MKYFFILIVLLSSCKVSRQVSKTQTDSLHVNKIDSGQVKKEISQSKSENEWWREYLLTNKPEPSERTLQPIYNTQPILIREGGKSSNENYNLKIDSSWKKESDSLKVKIMELEKKSKTTVLNFWQILGIAIGASLIIFILSKLKIPFR